MMSAVADRPDQKPSPEAATAPDAEPSRGGTVTCCYREAQDGELIDVVLAGDRRGFAELVRRYQGPLLRLVFVFVRDRAVAEEVAQDAWLAALDGLEGFERRASFKAWLFRIASNTARLRREREARSVPFSALGEAGEDGGCEEPARFNSAGMWQDPPQVWGAQSGEETVRRAEAVRVMDSALAMLPEAHRAVLTLRDLENVGPVETCSLLGITMTNQRVLLHRARTRVRQALERHFRGVESC
jgi:RNA polymerase sigma-70 factor, ECF subfamily